MTLVSLRLDPAELAAQLAALGDQGIACLHQGELEQPGALPSGVLLVLAGLGILQPLTTRIPSCPEHGCPLVPRCPYVRDFERSDRSQSSRAKGGRKFRVVRETGHLVRQPAVLAELLPQHPVVRWLAQCFARRERWSRFELATAWLDQALACADRAGAPQDDRSPATPSPDFDGSRRELAACLALLAGLGWLDWEQDGFTVRLVHPWWRA
ncbi:MAG: hypothetical protein RMK01_11715 [Thermomicrobium sp.]|nr:hypothetical protein [Thermomicrobium sp.]